jgi:REP element-mobilizing transposase RayT
MKFDPQKHHRRSIRLCEYDYAKIGAYFVTICTYQRECLFGEIVDGLMCLNNIGLIVQMCWHNLPRHFTNVQLDSFVIMPNHLHGIIVIGDDCRGEALVQTNHNSNSEISTQVLRPSSQSQGTKPGSLGAIIQNFKSVSTRKINQIRAKYSHLADGIQHPYIWQRNYYEHVIRNEESWHRIRQYIVENPIHWAEDKENRANQVK